MISFEWYTLPIVGSGASTEDAKRPDLSSVGGTILSWACAQENGTEMLVLVSVQR